VNPNQDSINCSGATLKVGTRHLAEPFGYGVLNIVIDTSKATFLRVNNNNENFSVDVLYFVRENLKRVQESWWNFRIFAKVQVSER
jgi:hypothetical protein